MDIIDGWIMDGYMVDGLVDEGVDVWICSIA